jgi:excisionase family DNA binding protein
MADADNTQRKQYRRPNNGTREPATAPLLLKVQEVARQLGLGRTTVYEMIANGEIDLVRKGRTVRIPYYAVEDWIKGHTMRRATSQE